MCGSSYISYCKLPMLLLALGFMIIWVAVFVAVWVMFPAPMLSMIIKIVLWIPAVSTFITARDVTFRGSGTIVTGHIEFGAEVRPGRIHDLS